MMYVKLPIAVFELHLSATALKIYCGLLACADRQGKAVVRQGRLAEICHVTRSTASAAVQELACAGLCSVKHQYKQDGTYRANCCSLALLGGRWVAMPVSSATMELPNSAFAVYAAMLSFRGRTGCAFPSLRRIQAMLALARNTVIRAIRVLCSCGLLRKRPMWAGKHNLYIVVLLQKGAAVIGAKRMSAPAITRSAHNRQTLISTINTISVPFAHVFVKSFAPPWVVQFLCNKPLPTLLQNKRKSYKTITIVVSVRKGKHCSGRKHFEQSFPADPQNHILFHNAWLNSSRAFFFCLRKYSSGHQRPGQAQPEDTFAQKTCGQNPQTRKIARFSGYDHRSYLIAAYARTKGSKVLFVLTLYIKRHTIKMKNRRH